MQRRPIPVRLRIGIESTWTIIQAVALVRSSDLAELVDLSVVLICVVLRGVSLVMSERTDKIWPAMRADDQGELVESSTAALLRLSVDRSPTVFAGVFTHRSVPSPDCVRLHPQRDLHPRETVRAVQVYVDDGTPLPVGESNGRKQMAFLKGLEPYPVCTHPQAWMIGRRRVVGSTCMRIDRAHANQDWDRVLVDVNDSPPIGRPLESNLRSSAREDLAGWASRTKVHPSNYIEQMFSIRARYPPGREV